MQELAALLRSENALLICLDRTEGVTCMSCFTGTSGLVVQCCKAAVTAVNQCRQQLQVNALAESIYLRALPDIREVPDCWLFVHPAVPLLCSGNRHLHTHTKATVLPATPC
jgi:hypothetical protein